MAAGRERAACRVWAAVDTARPRAALQVRTIAVMHVTGKWTAMPCRKDPMWLTPWPDLSPLSREESMAKAREFEERTSEQRQERQAGELPALAH